MRTKLLAVILGLGIVIFEVNAFGQKELNLPSTSAPRSRPVVISKASELTIVWGTRMNVSDGGCFATISVVGNFCKEPFKTAIMFVPNNVVHVQAGPGSPAICNTLGLAAQTLWPMLVEVTVTDGKAEITSIYSSYWQLLPVAGEDYPELQPWPVKAATWWKEFRGCPN